METHAETDVRNNTERRDVKPTCEASARVARVSRWFTGKGLVWKSDWEGIEAYG